MIGAESSAVLGDSPVDGDDEEYEALSTPADWCLLLPSDGQDGERREHGHEQFW